MQTNTTLLVVIVVIALIVIAVAVLLVQRAPGRISPTIRQGVRPCRLAPPAPIDPQGAVIEADDTVMSLMVAADRPAIRVSDETSTPVPSSTVKPGIQEPVGRSQATTVRSDATSAPDQPTMLFAESEVGDFRSRWSSIQTAFVDEPRQAVEDVGVRVSRGL